MDVVANIGHALYTDGNHGKSTNSTHLHSTSCINRITSKRSETYRFVTLQLITGHTVHAKKKKQLVSGFEHTTQCNEALVWHSLTCADNTGPKAADAWTHSLQFVGKLGKRFGETVGLRRTFERRDCFSEQFWETTSSNVRVTDCFNLEDTFRRLAVKSSDRSSEGGSQKTCVVSA
jgi:hypothetical protein